MYYDGGCPVCMRGVRHYQRLDWARRIEWVDLLNDPDVLKPHGVDFSEAMERLHVLDARGELVSGAAAFVALWRELPWYRVLAVVTKIPGIMPVMNAVYDRMTHGRYARRCREGLCGVSRNAR